MKTSFISLSHFPLAVPDDPDDNIIVFCLKDLEGNGELCEGNDNEDTLTVPDDDDKKNGRALNNTAAFTRALQDAQPGDTVLVPDGSAYTLFGGVVAEQKDYLTVDIAGSLHFVHDLTIWPKRRIPSTMFTHRNYVPGLSFVNCTNLTITCTSKTQAKVDVDMKRYMVRLVDSATNRGGIINGNGKGWWNDVIAGRIHEHEGTRPRLLHIVECEDILIEKLTLINSPYWTVTVEARKAEVRYVNVIVDREVQAKLFEQHEIDNGPSQSSIAFDRMLQSVEFPIPIDDLPDWVGRKMRQPQDLNTDGIDPIGEDIWIHDCIIQNADDSVAVKPLKRGRNNTRLPDCTNNITLTNLVLTGFGASVGSVGPVENHHCVDNVTFRNITMPGTARGIYIKSNGASCFNESSQITNILYEHVDIIEPYWWALWIGPQQQHQPGESLGYNVSPSTKLPLLVFCLSIGTHLRPSSVPFFNNLSVRYFGRYLVRQSVQHKDVPNLRTSRFVISIFFIR
jgi:hypothetical protein